MAMARTKLTVRRRLDLRHNQKPFKIKTILPEQRTVQVKKNGNVIKTINVRRKTTYFNNRWAITFLKTYFVLNIVNFNDFI